MDAELRGLVDQPLAEAGERTGTLRSADHPDGGLLAYAAVPIVDLGEGPPPGAVVVGIVLPARLASNLEAIDRAAGVYKRFRAQRRDLVRLYLTLIGLIFLVTLFIATWIGFYMSRRITVPIQDLAAAAREISAGNLDVRVRAEIGDELGMLVDAFNEMAGELQENREVITRSTADLRRSNRALDERRRYIETLVANLSTAVISLDSDGRVTTANPAVEPDSGRRRLDRRDPVRETLARRRASSRCSSCCDRRVPPAARNCAGSSTLPRGPEPCNVSVQISPLRGAAGENLGTLIMVEDLTELLRAQKAAAWREVARRIAHEIKNPLTPIQLSAQRLRKKFRRGRRGPGPGGPRGDRLDRARGRRAEAAGGRVLPFRADARTVAAERSICPRWWNRCWRFTGGCPGFSGRSSLDPTHRARWRWIAEQMRRALINLIDNAVAAMAGEGTIIVKTRAPAVDGAAAHRGRRLRPGPAGRRTGTRCSPLLLHEEARNRPGAGHRAQDRDGPPRHDPGRGEPASAGRAS